MPSDIRVEFQFYHFLIIGPMNEGFFDSLSSLFVYLSYTYALYPK